MIKPVTADGGEIVAVFPDPFALRKGRIEEIQTIPDRVGTAECKPCSENALGKNHC